MTLSQKQMTQNLNTNVSTHKFSHLLFEKRSQKHKVEKINHLQLMVLGKPDIYIQKKELDLYQSTSRNIAQWMYLQKTSVAKAQ